MVKILKKIFTPLTKNNITWFFLAPFSKIGIYLYMLRTSREKEKSETELQKILFENLTVKNGPFKGMKYPGIESICSSISPKLLGSYEKELWETIYKFKNNNYTEIIDIGCAEGYYAVGLGMIIPDTKVIAYDTDETARNLCHKMATLNNVSSKITINSECTAETLETFPFTGKSLIICDCEGYEKKLFNSKNVKNLINCDLIIEAHDFVNRSISKYLKEVFKETHNIESIKSIDDFEKALTYNFTELEKLTLMERKNILAERRPEIMEWLICTPKNSSK